MPTATHGSRDGIVLRRLDRHLPGSGAVELSDTSARCAADLIDDAAAREVLVTELDRAYDDPSQPDAEPFPDNVQPLVEALESCATPDELNRLDCN